MGPPPSVVLNLLDSWAVSRGLKEPWKETEDLRGLFWKDCGAPSPCKQAALKPCSRRPGRSAPRWPRSAGNKAVLAPFARRPLPAPPRLVIAFLGIPGEEVTLDSFPSQTPLTSKRKGWTAQRNKSGRVRRASRPLSCLGCAGMRAGALISRFRAGHGLGVWGPGADAIPADSRPGLPESRRQGRDFSSCDGWPIAQASDGAIKQAKEWEAPMMAGTGYSGRGGGLLCSREILERTSIPHLQRAPSSLACACPRASCVP